MEASWVFTIKWSINVYLINKTFDTKLNTPAVQYHDHLSIAVHPVIVGSLVFVKLFPLENFFSCFSCYHQGLPHIIIEDYYFLHLGPLISYKRQK